MKKIILSFLITLLLSSCPTPDGRRINWHTPALIKSQYCNNIEVTNNSSYEIQYKYAPSYRKDRPTLLYSICIQSKRLPEGEIDSHVNILGTLKKGDSRILYTGVDGGDFTYDYLQEHGRTPNFNVDGLPGRFVIMIDDSICYSLAYNYKLKNKDATLVIDDQIVQKLKAIKPEDYVEGYNSKRYWYGKSVKVADRLYCFEQYDSGKSSMRDYSYIEGKEIREYVDFKYNLEGLYGKVYFYNFKDRNLFFYDDDDKKFYAVGKGDNPTVEEVK